MSRFQLFHVTEFDYDAPVSESYNEVHLRPRDDELQRCQGFRLATEPRSTPAASRDYFGNWVHRFNVLPAHDRLRVQAESMVVVQPPPTPALDALPLAVLETQREDLFEQHYDFLVPTAYVPHAPPLADLVRDAEVSSGAMAGRFALAAAALVRDRFRYAKGATHVHSNIGDVLAAGAGVCQDFTHLLLGILRMRGLPARYVSGYLVPYEDEDSPGEVVSGAQTSHSWAEVFVPGPGWIGFDAITGGPVTDRHIRVAYGRDYADVAPVRGVYRGQAGQRLSVDVRLRPVVDDAGNDHVRETLGQPSGGSLDAARPAGD